MSGDEVDIRGKPVHYTLHVLEKLSRENHIDIINNILRTGKWESFGKNMFNIRSRQTDIVLIVKEMPDRFKIITIGGKYGKEHKM